jgi:hypothetical protein
MTRGISRRSSGFDSFTRHMRYVKETEVSKRQKRREEIWLKNKAKAKSSFGKVRSWRAGDV